MPCENERVRESHGVYLNKTSEAYHLPHAPTVCRQHSRLSCVLSGTEPNTHHTHLHRNQRTATSGSQNLQLGLLIGLGLGLGLEVYCLLHVSFQCFTATWEVYIHGGSRNLICWTEPLLFVAGHDWLRTSIWITLVCFDFRVTWLCQLVLSLFFCFFCVVLIFFTFHKKESHVF